LAVVVLEVAVVTQYLVLQLVTVVDFLEPLVVQEVVVEVELTSPVHQEELVMVTLVVLQDLALTTTQVTMALAVAVAQAPQVRLA
jgi:hypothetical protein